MPVTNPVSQVPFGAVATNVALAAVSVVNMTDGSVTQTMGNLAVGDGGGASYSFVGASTAFVDGVNVVGTPTTGRWISESAFSGVGTVVGTAPTVSLSGVGETFVVVSGGAAPLVYTFAPSVTMIGKLISLKNISTGNVQIRATGGDVIFDLASLYAVNFISGAVTGAYNFHVCSGAFYRT